MLHRIVMVGLVVVGLVVAGLGVASATVWRPSDTAVMTTGEQSGATLLTTAPGVLSLVDRDVTITARSSDDAKVVLAVGSQVDVDGWIGEDPALRVTGASDWETLTVATATSTGSETAEATGEAADPAAETTDAADVPPADATTAPGPDPSGSDMWVESTSGTGTATLAWDATSTDQVLLVAAVGDDVTSPQLTLSWPREVTTPLLWPGVALGVLLVVLGLIYGIVTRARRRRRTTSAAERPAADETTTPTPAAGTPGTGALTRRQLREVAEQREVEAAAAAAAPRPKRQWPWTGAIPVVKPADPQGAVEDGEKVVAPEAHRPAWLPEGTASTSGSSWRAAWGVPTPDPSSSDVPDHAPSAGGPGLSTSGTEPVAAEPAPPVATPPVRPVDQSSPFQRITLRSSDESAPARRIRRDQQAPVAWSASRSPWAHPARPGVPDAPRPAPGSDGTPPTDTTDAPKTPTDDTTKDSD